MHFFRKLWWWLMRAKHQKSWGLRLIREKTISQYVSSCLVEHGSLMRSYVQDIFSSVNEEVHATKQTCCPSMKRRGITKLSKLFSLLSIFIFYFRRCKKSHSISAKLMITDKVFCTVLLLFCFMQNSFFAKMDIFQLSNRTVSLNHALQSYNFVLITRKEISTQRTFS